MIALEILDVKKCMSDMLAGEAFDGFLLREASITTGNNFLIDGTLVEDFYDENDRAINQIDEGYMPYKLERGICFEIIKGKRTPHSFRFTFLASKREYEGILGEIASQDIANMTLNILYANGKLTATTAVTHRGFSMDKSAELAWDKWVRDFFRQLEIAVSDMI
ncbi:MAG: hypothetical protein IJ655_00660 [Lachnospiraceae bacterium]|nr:hypothetical protein [Lachnospiraceae bacterium]